MSGGYREMATSREHWDTKRKVKIAALQTRLAEVTEERDRAFEIWRSFHVATLAAFVRNEHEPLKARLAEAEALLRECVEYIERDASEWPDFVHDVFSFLRTPDSAPLRESET